ncbi:MAG: hypothetical protein AcusKO_38640 [Acuticoccus sp.]
MPVAVTHAHAVKRFGDRRQIGGKGGPKGKSTGDACKEFAHELIGSPVNTKGMATPARLAKPDVETTTKSTKPHATPPSGSLSHSLAAQMQQFETKR